MVHNLALYFAKFCRFITPIAFAGVLCCSVSGEVIVHETFSDDDILDDSPATWEYSCQDPYGGCVNSTIDLQDGIAEVTLGGFAMWSLVSVGGQDGQVIEPDNNWSIRARITGQTFSNSLVGVGIDSYHWSGGMYQGSQAGLGLGNPFSSSGGNRRHDFFEPWVVQLDVFPDRLEAYRWPADDPGNIARATWSNGSSIGPGRPVFWGNWGGKPLFHEVVVADSPMGVGGDFDLNDELDLADLNALSQAIQSGGNDPRYNLTNDEAVDVADLDVWVRKLKHTHYGDANLDGSVDFGDFVTLSSNFGTDGDWSQGDFDVDGTVAFPDFTLLSSNFGQTSSRTQAVPEPSTGFSIGMAVVIAGWLRPKRRSTLSRGQSARLFRVSVH